MQSNPVSNRRPALGPSVELLTDFCKEELAAAQTYEKALSLPVLKQHSDVLGRCYASHHNRVAELSQRITSLGGEAPTSAGVWGSLVPTLAIAAAAVSAGLAISLLEEGEDRGTRRYRDHVAELDAPNQLFALDRIIPAQTASHAALSQLKLAVNT